MNEAPRYVTFRDYLRVARERRILVVMVALLFAGAALYYSLRQAPVYTTTASLEFQSINTQITPLGQRVDEGGQTPEQRAAINASTLVRPAVLDRATVILKGRRPPGSVTARPEARTNLVVVQGASTSGKLAADLTNAFAQAAADVSRDALRKSLGGNADALRRVLKADHKRGRSRLQFYRELQTRDTIARLEELARVATPVIVRREAAVPRSPDSPKPLRTTLLGLLIGLTLGLVAAFVRDSLDRRFKNAREITEEMHLPLLGFVPEGVLGQALVEGKGLKALSEDDMEAFRVLRTNAEFLNVDDPPKLLLVTSALPKEGKSTIAAALATAYAMAGKRTLLVECDLRRPTLAGRLGVQTSPGLTDYLAGRATPAEVLQTIALPGGPANGNQVTDATLALPFVVIAAGSQAPQPAELLRSKRCRQLFEQVKVAYDIVIIDSCPLLAVVDTLELLPIADAVVVCVRASKTTRDQARAAKAALSHFPDQPAGIVVTGVRSRADAAQSGYYSYGYAYGSDPR